MNDYKAIIVCVVFNEKYEFNDIQIIGPANSKDKAKALLFDDIRRVMGDYAPSKCELEESRTEQDEPIMIVHTHDAEGFTMHWHYYCKIKSEE